MTKRRMKVALGLFLALGTWGTAKAVATNPAYEDLLVTFTGNLSVKVDGLQYSSRTFSAGAGVTTVPSSATVTNDGTFTEKWQLSVADLSSPGWTLTGSTGTAAGGTYCENNIGAGGCPGLEEYALQALFISSASAATCPARTSTHWEQFVSTVSATPATYLMSQFADTNVISGSTGKPDGQAGSANGNMLINNPATGVGQKGLCVRLTMPSSVNTATQEQLIRLTITAINGG